MSKSTSLTDISEKSTLPAVITSGSALAGPQGLSGFSSAFLNALTFGHIGKAVTFALNQTGYSRNSDALKAAYRANPQAVDNYLDQVNTDKIVKNILKGSKPKVTKVILPSLAGGLVLGAAGMMFFNRK
jgi:hypothetical protein